MIPIIAIVFIVGYIFYFQNLFFLKYGLPRNLKNDFKGKKEMKVAYDVYLPSSEEDQTKSPVILLHGRLDSRKTWKNFGPDIADKTGRKVYALDARNHGESPWSNEMDFDILSKDLDEFMTDHDIPKAVLVGHSMGGKTAIVYALSKPDKVEKLFVEDMVVENYSPSVKNTVGQTITLLRMSLKAIAPDADELIAKQAVYDFINSLYKTGKARGFLYAVDTLPLKKTDDGYQWQANLDVLEDMLNNKSSCILSGAYHGEALFLYGSESFFEVGKDESIPRYFPRAIKICLGGAGHLIHQDFPDIFMTELLKFIES